MTALDVGIESPRARPHRLLVRRFLRRPVAVGSLLVITVFAVTALFAPYIAPQDPAAVDLETLLAHPSSAHLFGTDDLGRDVMSRLIWGARASLQVGFLATTLAFVIAVPLGLFAGYYRGWCDSVIARATDIALAFPFLVLALALAAILGPSLTTATLALGIAAVPGLTRITRGETFALRNAEFVPAAITNGAGDATIIFRHILPNMTNTLLVQVMVTVPRVIIGEATLSYLGLGVQRPMPSWGVMLHDAQSYDSQAPRLAVLPGVAIVLTAFAFNLLGDGVRDVFDRRTDR